MKILIGIIKINQHQSITHYGKLQQDHGQIILYH